MHLLAVWIHDYAPATGSAITVDFGAVGTWTWQRAADRWSVLEGSGDRATAWIAVSPAATVAMLSRGMAQGEVVTSLTIAGDEPLARGVIDIVAPLVALPTA
jgi:hypothetical protein